MQKLLLRNSMIWVCLLFLKSCLLYRDLRINDKHFRVSLVSFMGILFHTSLSNKLSGDKGKWCTYIVKSKIFIPVCTSLQSDQSQQCSQKPCMSAD